MKKLNSTALPLDPRLKPAGVTTGHLFVWRCTKVFIPIPSSVVSPELEQKPPILDTLFSCRKSRSKPQEGLYFRASCMDSHLLPWPDPAKPPIPPIANIVELGDVIPSLRGARGV